MTSSSAILFRNESGTVWLLDLPRSIEESQLPSRGAGLPDRRLKSSQPPSQPFSTPEPRDGRHPNGSTDPAAQVRELMTRGTVESAVEELRRDYSGPWCLPRLIGNEEEKAAPASSAVQGDAYYIPPRSHYLLGTIQGRREEFIQTAPIFDLVVLDPPWPNRSAQRKKGSYSTAATTDAVRDLLSLIPIASKLSSDGIVAVWVTNKPILTAMLTAPGGVFSLWGVELVDTWTWLKVTTAGEPIFDVDSQWRRPWEQVLVARRVGSQRRVPRGGRVLVSVPDIHSRKPNLGVLFTEYLPDDYTALEIFARNLTAGWWSWGDEVLEHQRHGHWVETDK